jgi:hypothetical protein
MSMTLKALTLPFVPALGGFDPAPIEALTRQAEILEATPAFFERGGTQYRSANRNNNDPNNRNNNLGLRLASTARDQRSGVHGLPARMRVVQAFIPLRRCPSCMAPGPRAMGACRAKSRGRRGS